MSDFSFGSCDGDCDCDCDFQCPDCDCDCDCDCKSCCRCCEELCFRSCSCLYRCVVECFESYVCCCICDSHTITDGAQHDNFDRDLHYHHTTHMADPAIVIEPGYTTRTKRGGKQKQKRDRAFGDDRKKKQEKTREREEDASGEELERRVIESMNETGTPGGAGIQPSAPREADIEAPQISDLRTPQADYYNGGGTTHGASCSHAGSWEDNGGCSVHEINSSSLDKVEITVVKDDTHPTSPDYDESHKFDTGYPTVAPPAYEDAVTSQPNSSSREHVTL